MKITLPKINLPSALKPLAQTAVDMALPTAKSALVSTITAKMPSNLGVEGQLVAALFAQEIANWKIKI